MADYKAYLASAILTEDKTVTYRLLSRALKVNVNTAKEMLYDFHKKQNAKKPATIHATYLLSGTKPKDEPEPTNDEIKKDEEGDDYMQSSPFMGSSIPQLQESTGESSVLTITLVREENLEDMKSQYDHISSIHVYSIGPHPMKNLQVLSDTTREIQQLCLTEDPLEFAPKYGTITNRNVKRRTGKRPIPPPEPAVVSKAPVVKSKQTEAPKSTPAAKPEAKASKPSTANDFFGKGKEKAKPAAAASNPPSKESTPNPPTLKRDSSSIFKSFAKAKPKLVRENTGSSAAASPAISAAEDSPMKDVDDDDGEEDTWVPEVKKESAGIVESDREARKKREADLRKMMEEDSEEEVVATPASAPTPAAEEEVEEEKEKPAEVSTGRRRARRRIMKKERVTDEDGFLVTKETPVWESYSEDEPVEKVKKVQPAAAALKPKKGAASKVGQGNIMSFFGKK